MSIADWIVLIITVGATFIYGIYKGKGQSDADSYLLAGSKMPWYTVLLGIMATQASAITFISGPGQAYADGMRFLQYYFGLPIAMVVISAVFIPYFRKQKVYTAYQFLEQRFDRKTRFFTGLLFLFSRGVSTGLSVYAPAIVISAIFGWNIYLTNILTGGALIIYTFIGGAKAVAHTQKVQFIIILFSMLVAGILILTNMPDSISTSDALYIAGKSEKLNIITTHFAWNDKYNIWSGLIGGFFLSLSYFGTDQSQVGRYLSGKDIAAARKGILLNGIIKIPMQFFILLIGALLFSLFTFIKAPLFFNEAAITQLEQKVPDAVRPLQVVHHHLSTAQQNVALKLAVERDQLSIDKSTQMVQSLQSYQKAIQDNRAEVSKLIKDTNIPMPATDTNYVFLYFVQHYLPVGIVGLVFAIIFLASWGSISAALNSLASATLVDFHQLLKRTPMHGAQELFYGRIYTLFWGIFSITIAMFAVKMGSLIEAVNVLGSLFYGAMLGIFLVAFFLKHVHGNAVFWAAILAEITVVYFYIYDIVEFLWLNVVGAIAVILYALLFQIFSSNRKKSI